MIDNLHKEVKGLKKERGDPTLIAKVEARGAELARQLYEVERHFTNYAE